MDGVLHKLLKEVPKYCNGNEWNLLLCVGESDNGHVQLHVTFISLPVVMSCVKGGYNYSIFIIAYRLIDLMHVIHVFSFV